MDNRSIHQLRMIRKVLYLESSQCSLQSGARISQTLLEKGYQAHAGRKIGDRKLPSFLLFAGLKPCVPRRWHTFNPRVFTLYNPRLIILSADCKQNHLRNFQFPTNMSRHPWKTLKYSGTPAVGGRQSKMTDGLPRWPGSEEECGERLIAYKRSSGAVAGQKASHTQHARIESREERRSVANTLRTDTTYESGAPGRAITFLHEARGIFPQGDDQPPSKGFVGRAVPTLCFVVSGRLLPA